MIIVTKTDGTKIQTDFSLRFTNKMENHPGVYVIICPNESDDLVITFLADEIKTIEDVNCEVQLKAALQYIADWDSFKDHPIGKKATQTLSNCPVS